MQNGKRFKRNDKVIDCFDRSISTVIDAESYGDWVLIQSNRFDAPATVLTHKSNLQPITACRSCEYRLKCIIRNGMKDTKEVHNER